ncbi:MAG: tyrosine--tRNA ligase [Sulfurimonadaceae bacterium]|jgi:tyrosyl-tRNA synthetase|nr:tyrosine--tRNA ligase [Sulfurimonadaceae bacterium]
MLEVALKEIQRGSAEIIGLDEIKKLLKAYFDEGKTYTIKAGFDPTAPDLHLGHTVLLQKLAIFQKYGAKVQFLIGDFTAQIGDPSGKNATRKMLSHEDILKNAQTYKEQVYKVLDESKMEVVFNSSWLNELGSSGLVALTTTFSVARMLERDDFEKRYKDGSTIAISEFIYPLLQGYDSVHLKSDIEIGGTDQKFNLLMGRTLQRTYAIAKEQSVIMMPILEGLDGVNKMSKSLNNYIGVKDEPNDMFAKVLSVSDELMWRYYELLSAKTLDEIASLKDGVKSGELHPKKVKEELALEIVSRYHSQAEAKEALDEFNRVHASNEIPSDIEEFECESGVWIVQAMQDAKLSPSSSQARRDIKAGALKIDSQKVTDEQLKLNSGEYIVQVGKRKFAKIKVK